MAFTKTENSRHAQGLLRRYSSSALDSRGWWPGWVAVDDRSIYLSPRFRDTTRYYTRSESLLDWESGKAKGAAGWLLPLDYIPQTSKPWKIPSYDESYWSLIGQALRKFDQLLESEVISFGSEFRKWRPELMPSNFESGSKNSRDNYFDLLGSVSAVHSTATEDVHIALGKLATQINSLLNGNQRPAWRDELWLMPNYFDETIVGKHSTFGIHSRKWKHSPDRRVATNVAAQNAHRPSIATHEIPSRWWGLMHLSPFFDSSALFEHPQLVDRFIIDKTQSFPRGCLPLLDCEQGTRNRNLGIFHINSVKTLRGEDARDCVDEWPMMKSVIWDKVMLLEKLMPGLGQWYYDKFTHTKGDDTISMQVHEVFRVLHYDSDSDSYICQSTSMMGDHWLDPVHGGDGVWWTDEVTEAAKHWDLSPLEAYKDLAHTLPLFVVTRAMVDDGVGTPPFVDDDAELLGFGDVIVLYGHQDEGDWSGRQTGICKAIHGSQGVYDVVINSSVWTNYRVHAEGVRREFVPGNHDLPTSRNITKGEWLALSIGASRLHSTMNIASDTKIPEDPEKPNWRPTHSDHRLTQHVDVRPSNKRMGGKSDIVRCQDCNGRCVVYTDSDGKPGYAKCPHCRSRKGLQFPQLLKGANPEFKKPEMGEED